MRLALKLLSSLAVTTLVALALLAWSEQHRREELMQLDLEAEVRMARALRAAVMAVSDAAGPDVARRIVTSIDATVPRSLRWLSLNEVPSVPGRDLRAEVTAHLDEGTPVWIHRMNEAGDELRYVYIPVPSTRYPPAAIEVSESLATRHAYVRRSQVHTAAVGLVVLALSGALAVILGRMLIGRPLTVITDGVRALGEGRFDALPPVRRRDELGALASELTSLGARLAARERLQHEDRLRTVGQLASGVAHELGTPLSVISVRARMIASREATGDEAASSAQAIVEQSDRMTRLVRQLLDYARREPPHPALVDVRDIVRKTMEMIDPLARKAGVIIDVQAGDHPIETRADPGQLQQVVTNLAINAVQAMERGGRLDIAIDSDRVAPPQGGPRADHCRIVVSDDGPGIPPEHLPHVFEPFFTTKQTGEGTGLGLPVAQAIVAEHGGWMSVASEAGHGARFTVFLPAASAAVERAA